MSLQPLSPQWAIDATASGTLEVAKGLLHAATTDNVQLLALLACEKFGNTIAMSQEIIRKIEKTVVPAPKPALLNFVQISVGYAANDSVVQLGRSAAGLRFLGLAAALATTLGPFESAEVIQSLLDSRASDKTTVPTLRHVKDLLERVEPRCYQAGFAASTAGWEILISQAFQKSPSTGPSPSEPTWCHPGAKGVANLVNAFHQLFRIGNDDVTGITIRTTACAPWTAAFCKWCLGFSPSMIFEDGSPILEQRDSAVSIILERRDLDFFRVIINSSIDCPSELVSPNDPCQPFWGMMPIQSYGQYLLRRYDMDWGSAQHVVEECLPHAVQLLLDNLIFSEEATVNMSYTAGNSVQRFSTRSDLLLPSQAGLGLSPLPSENTIYEVFSILLGTRESYIKSSLPSTLPITSLPPMQQHLQNLESECPGFLCRKCTYGQSCRKAIFLRDFSRLVADGLALSLFERPEELLVSSRPVNSRVDRLFNAVYVVMEKAKQTECSIDPLLFWALQRVGHNITDHSPWIMSSFKGQAVWPTIYETNTITKRGFLTLSWLHGHLLHRGDLYNVGVHLSTTHRVASPIIDRSSKQIAESLNLYPGLRLRWEVTILEGALALSLNLHDSTGTYSHPHITTNPAQVLANLAHVSFIEACTHDPEKCLERADANCRFFAPFNLFSAAAEQSRESAHSRLIKLQKNGQLQSRREPLPVPPISVVAVGGSDELRFFALSNIRGLPASAFLRKNACLRCCLDICRKDGDLQNPKFLIL